VPAPGVPLACRGLSRETANEPITHGPSIVSVFRNKFYFLLTLHLGTEQNFSAIAHHPDFAQLFFSRHARWDKNA
jgi:hypothetical protein